MCKKNYDLFVFLIFLVIFNICNNGKIVLLKMLDFFLKIYVVIFEDIENDYFLDVLKNMDYV